MNGHAVLAAGGGAALTLVLGAGCSGGARDAVAPTCSTANAEALVLVAQSVPTAERIPCITAYPGGWRLGHVDVRNGRTTFSLGANGSGPNGVRVTLEKACVVADATPSPTDEPGTVRYDRLPAPDGSTMVRTYTFPGGCVTYDFHLGRRPGAVVDEASLAVGFVTRAEIEARYGAPIRGRTK